MYSGLKEVFQAEKLTPMVVEDEDRLYFPNRLAEKKIFCSSDDTLAMAFASVLRAGFNSKNLNLIKDENTITVNFNDKPIHKLVFQEIDENNLSTRISNFIKAEIKKEKIDKVTYVFFEKDRFLEQANALGSYLSNLREFTTDNSIIPTVKNIRESSIKNSGIYIEEYENKKILLSSEDILTSNLISHHNTFSTQIIYKINNFEEFNARRNPKKGGRKVTGNFHIETSLAYGAQTPIYAFNPILSVANYRDLKLDLVKDMIDPFLDTLLSKANFFYNEKDKLKDLTLSTTQKERIECNAQDFLRVNGASKKLYSLAPNEEDVLTKNCEEILVYNEKIDNEDYICISSKGSCLGNGQHSTTVFNILNLVLNYNDENFFTLKEHYELSEKEMGKLFNVNSNNNPYKKAHEKLLDKIVKSGLTHEQFMSFFNQVYMEIDWEVAPNDISLKNAIQDDNTQKPQDSSDDWINENKEIFSIFLTQYNNATKEINKEFAKIAKDSNHPLYKFQTTINISGIKTPEASPLVSYEYSNSVNINEIYSLLSFVIPNNKNNSPFDADYAAEAHGVRSNSKENLRNVYQADSMKDENLYKIFNETFHSRFLKPDVKSAFENFLLFMASESLAGNTSDSTRFEKFKSMINTVLSKNQTDIMMKKIPAIILYRDMAQHYFNIIKDVIPKDVISNENFINLAFVCFTSNLGKKGNDKNGFNLKNITENGEIVLMNICNSLHRYYSKENAVKTNDLKRIHIKDNIHGLTDIKELTVELFEPWCNKVNFNLPAESIYNSKLLKNLQFKSIDEFLKNKKDEISEYFHNYFEPEDKNKRPKI